MRTSFRGASFVNSIGYTRMYVYECIFACVRLRVRMWMCACVNQSDSAWLRSCVSEWVGEGVNARNFSSLLGYVKHTLESFLERERAFLSDNFHSKSFLSRGHEGGLCTTRFSYVHFRFSCQRSKWELRYSFSFRYTPLLCPTPFWRTEKGCL